MTIGRQVIIAALAAGALAASGCSSHTTRVYSYEMPVVWQACLRETVIWRPDRLNENDLEISSTRMLLGGGELRYELKVTPLTPFMGRPRTRVAVRIAQTKPTADRYEGQEAAFLDRVSRGLPMMSKAPPDRYER